MGDIKDDKFGFSEGTAVDLDGSPIKESNKKSQEKAAQEQPEPADDPDGVSADEDNDEELDSTMAMDSALIAEQMNLTAPPLPGNADDGYDSDSAELPMAPEVLDEESPEKTMAMESPPIPELGGVEGVGENSADSDTELPSIEDDDDVEATMAMETPHIAPKDSEEEVEKTAAMDVENLSFPADEDEADEREASKMPAMDPEDLSFPADEDETEEQEPPKTLAMEPPEIESPAPEEPPTTEQEQGKENLAAELTAAVEEFSGDRTMMFDAAELLKSRDDHGPHGVLTVVYGADKDNEYYLKGESTMVGRSLDCDIVINDRSVSRKHFRIDRRQGKFYLVDLGSGNGTKVNGMRVADLLLEDDVQIEAGTTILSFGYVGSSQRAPAEVRYSVRTADKRLKVIFSSLAVSVIGVCVFLLGQSMGWWSVFDDGNQMKRPAIVAIPSPPGERHLNRAQRFLAEKSLSDAQIALEDAEDAQANTRLIARIQDRITNARSHEKLLILQKNAFERGEYQPVLQNLETIPTTSPFFTDADELRDKAKRKIVEQWKDKAYRLQDEGKDKEAIALLKQVLQENPDDAEASAIINELGGGENIVAAVPKVQPKAEPEPNIKTKAKEVPPKKTKAAVKKAKAKPEKPKSGLRTKSLTVSFAGNRQAVKAPRTSMDRANLRRGYKLYDNGKFSEAADYLDAISQNTRHRKSDRKKAQILADRIVAFASAYRQAKAAVARFKPANAIPLLEKSRTLDKRITGAFGGEIRRNLARMYAFKAAGSYSSKQYKTAAKMASKALKLNPGESSARLVQTQVNNKVNALMSEALAAKNQGNYGRAKKLFKQLLGILPSQDNRYAQASRMLRDIVADEDDDEDD